MANNINISKAPIVVQDAVLSRIREGIVRARLTPYRSSSDFREYKSYLNTDVYGSFTFGDIFNLSANNYVDQFGVTKTFTPVRFHECTFQIAQTKNIVTTPLQGYNGTIKEYMSDGDFEISIDGVLSGIFNPITRSFSKSSSYPENYVQDMVRALKVPAAIPVSNNILSNIFGVNYVVVKSYSFPRNTAGMNYQGFKLDLISDRPIEIILTEGDLDNNQKLSQLLTG